MFNPFYHNLINEKLGVFIATFLALLAANIVMSHLFFGPLYQSFTVSHLLQIKLLFASLHCLALVALMVYLYQKRGQSALSFMANLVVAFLTTLLPIGGIFFMDSLFIGHHSILSGLIFNHLQGMELIITASCMTVGLLILGAVFWYAAHKLKHFHYTLSLQNGADNSQPKKHQDSDTYDSFKEKKQKYSYDENKNAERVAVVIDGACYMLDTHIENNATSKEQKLTNVETWLKRGCNNSGNDYGALSEDFKKTVPSFLAQYHSKKQSIQAIGYQDLFTLTKNKQFRHQRSIFLTRMVQFRLKPFSSFIMAAINFKAGAYSSNSNCIDHTTIEVHDLDRNQIHVLREIKKNNGDNSYSHTAIEHCTYRLSTESHVIESRFYPKAYNTFSIAAKDLQSSPFTGELTPGGQYCCNVDGVNANWTCTAAKI